MASSTEGVRHVSHHLWTEWAGPRYCAGAGVQAALLATRTASRWTRRICHSDYLIAVKGELELDLLDGTWKTIQTGDMLVGFAAVDKWRNSSKEWFRECQSKPTIGKAGDVDLGLFGVGFAVVAVPCEPLQMKGRPLDEEPAKAFKLA